MRTAEEEKARKKAWKKSVKGVKIHIDLKVYKKNNCIVMVYGGYKSLHNNDGYLDKFLDDLEKAKPSIIESIRTLGREHIRKNGKRHIVGQLGYTKEIQ